MNFSVRVFCYASILFAALLVEISVLCQESTSDESQDTGLTQSVSRSRRYVSVHTFKLDKAGRLPFTTVKLGINQQSRFLTKLGPYIVKLHLFLDSGLESQMNRDQSAMVKAAKQVVNHASTLLRPLNTYLMVTSLHFPSNPLATNYAIPNKDVLRFIRDVYTYNNYRVLVEEVINCVFVFVGRKLDNNVSDSEGNVCDKMYGRPTCVGFVTLDTTQPNYVNLSGFALAHELGHRLGGNHDSIEKCQCNFPQCLMDDAVGGTDDGKKPVGWSTCSIDRIGASLDNLAQDKACLSTNWDSETRTDGRSIKAEYSTDWGATCGNGIVEPSEECDCGGPLACKDNRCCRGDVCKLVDGVACGAGDCCNTTSCTPLTEGTLCRLAEDPRCDFPEFCDGKTPLCPPDVSVAPDWPCDKSAGHLCRLRHCLPPEKSRQFAKYSGQKCVDDNQVPTTLGECKLMHTPGPAEEIEDWVDDWTGDGTDTAVTSAANLHKPTTESENTDQEAQRLLGVPWLVAASSAMLLTVLE